MTDLISPEIFDHLVQLAALELSPDEAEYLRGQLNNQLKAIRELEAIPLPEDTPAATHGVPYPPQITPPIRPDEWLPDPDPQAILDQAPETQDGYIVVPEIPHADL
jgi:aspartyl/glutamyl-tRNA(Asn/Gln) amidotransferase C subunit